MTRAQRRILSSNTTCNVGCQVANDTRITYLVVLVQVHTSDTGIAQPSRIGYLQTSNQLCLTALRRLSPEEEATMLVVKGGLRGNFSYEYNTKTWSLWTTSPSEQLRQATGIIQSPASCSKYFYRIFLLVNCLVANVLI
jgi:hypothetical protein